ncbi:lytic transglycosylase domain-containing protein, partial [bacterium]|nr:lytic transglycosylase domain-containing protein [bacterium]
LKTAALREMECPNSAAIAVAALLEDRLPDKADFEEIGRLYEKGAACSTGTPTDQETIYTRAGLMYFAKGQYALAKPAFENASKVPDVFVGRALYWLFRTQTKLEDRKADDTLESLQAKYPFSFHSLVAQTSIGKDPGELLNRPTPEPTTRSRQDPEVNTLLEQVEILHRLEFNAAAGKVLNWAVALGKGAEPELLLYMAELKKVENDYRSKLFLLSDVLYKNPSLISRQSLELYFPKVLFPVFEKQSSVIDPYFLLAIARRESAFNTRAVSTANARGLLQVLPKTSRRISKKTNLFDPETNVEVGAKYVAGLLNRTEGNVHYALAAYNAGPNKLQAWTKNYPTDDPILFIDLIPFRETREYVGSVLRNYYWYRRIHQADKPIPSDKLLDIATGGGQG